LLQPPVGLGLVAPEKLKAALAKAYVMKEAPSFEGAFLVSAAPPSGSHREATGVGTGDGRGVVAG